MTTENTRLQKCREEVPRFVATHGLDAIIEAILWTSQYSTLADDPRYEAFRRALEAARTHYLEIIGYNTPENIEEQIKWLESLALVND